MSKRSMDELVFIRYMDHVLYNRASAMTMQPQVREAVGWLVYECDQYITLSWDTDAEPPTIRGGDPKASGLVLLKSDVLELKKIPLQKISEWLLNSPTVIVRDEYALQPKEAKNSKNRKRKIQ